MVGLSEKAETKKHPPYHHLLLKKLLTIPILYVTGLAEEWTGLCPKNQYTIILGVLAHEEGDFLYDNSSLPACDVGCALVDTLCSGPILRGKE